MVVDERTLEAAGARALARADALAPDAQAHWVPDEHGWRVPSSRPGEAPHLVTRKHPPTFATREDGTPTLRRSKGYWWFILTCSCPAEASGYVVCWHKAAVFRWWQRNRRVDGEAYADLAPHSNRTEQAAGNLDADGIERWKDRRRLGPAFRVTSINSFDCTRCPARSGEPCAPGCDCAMCDCDERSVPLASEDVDFDPGPGATRAMVENTRRLLEGQELPW
jgi:hypothetical protein